MTLNDRLPQLVRTLPVAHRVVIVTALAGLAMLAVLFARWVTAPSYTVLYSGLGDKEVAAAIGELETLAVPYRLEAGGSRVLVPRERLYETRAALASVGVSGAAVPQGYELLDQQGLSVSDFRQRVDYQRALEGEIARTLIAMDSVENATVHLVLPEKRLFAQDEEQVTASVLLDTARTLTPEEVETVAFLVSSSVEGLAPTEITVADVDGTVLNAPGAAAGAGALTSRNQRATRAFEEALAADLGALLTRVSGDARSAVVVRATLDFDERVTERETYEPDSGIALKEQTVGERYTGSGAPALGGAVGVDGGPLPAEGGETDYQREESVREFGVNREFIRTVAAPGAVRQLSVAVVMDDGERSGAAVPDAEEVEGLVVAALGLDPARGDSVAVTQIPFPAEDEAPADEPAAGGGPLSLLPEIAAGLVLVLAALALFLMTRRREEPSVEAMLAVHELPHAPGQALPPAPDQALPTAQATALPAGAGEVQGVEEGQIRQLVQANVTRLVEQQPEEIATLLRSWLADRR